MFLFIILAVFSIGVLCIVSHIFCLVYGLHGVKCSFQGSLYMHVKSGKWKTLKCGIRSTETEVRKPKCGSEKKSRLLMSSALLTHVKAL